MGYDNCFYCDDEAGECTPGCADNQNCPDEAPVCGNDHRCKPYGLPVLTKITAKTKSCSGCSNSNVEEGLQLHLVGRWELNAQQILLTTQTKLIMLLTMLLPSTEQFLVERIIMV